MRFLMGYSVPLFRRGIAGLPRNMRISSTNVSSLDDHYSP